MKHFTRHKPSGTRAERSIFGTIFNAMVSVLLVEVALLVASIYVMRVGPQLDQNAEDILAMQVENRSRYIQTILNDAQELSTLESEINALTQELLDSGRIDLATLDSSSITAYPLLEAATPKAHRRSAQQAGNRHFSGAEHPRPERALRWQEPALHLSAGSGPRRLALR